jgi:hypothetical protein
MNVKEFVSIWKKERDDLYSMYVSEINDTAVSKILNDLNLDNKQRSEINRAIDFILTDTFFCYLWG